MTKKRATADTAFQEDLAPETWAYDAAGPSVITRMIAEFTGTLTLVLVVVGTAIFLPQGTNGTLSVGLAFGVVVMAALVAIGPISGAHINPAVTLASWLAGRLPAKDVAPYILAQVFGAVAGGAAMFAWVNTNPVVNAPRAVMGDVSLGFDSHSPFQFTLVAALAAEFVATGLLIALFLSATSLRSRFSQAPLAVGLGATVLLIWAIPFTNGGLNPARATATALFAPDWALGQLWAWWLAPLASAVVVGFLYRAFGPEEDLMWSVREADAEEPAS
jgi:aquaporin Z